MRNGLENRLSQYEPLWGEWYVDSFLWENSRGTMFRLKDRHGRKSALKVMTIDANYSGRTLTALTSAALERINSMLPLAGEAYLVSCRNFSVKNIGAGTPSAADILVQTDEVFPADIYGGEQLSYMQARKLADNICRGIRHAHAKGFTFGAICPDNICMDTEGHYCLDAPSSCNPETPDPAYCAPETAGERYDKYRADIYSFGIVLYELFSGGMLPLQYKGMSREEAIVRRQSGEAFSPPTGAPPELQRIIMKACMAHPESRYRTIEEMYRELRALTVDHIPETYEQSIPRRQKHEQTHEHRAEQHHENHEHHSEHRTKQKQKKRKSADIGESKGMRIYVMVLLYMLLVAAIGFLIFAIFRIF